MGLRKNLVFGALLVSLLVVGVANAQHDQSGLRHQLIDVPAPSFGPRKVETVDSTQPFAGAGVFDYDTRAFAPLEFTNNKELEPNKGFYFTLDRIYASVTRAGGNIGVDTDAIQTGSEYIWGTRYDLGWFSDNDDGWGITFQDQEGAYFTNGRDVLVSNPMLVNVTLNTVEVNRIFRQTLSHGGYLEPYIGLRYTNITDRTLEDTNQVFVAAGPPTQVGNRFRQEVTNNAFGLQAGGRYNVRRGRWRTTTDAALATSYNQQRYFATDIATGAGVQAITETFQNDQSFVPIIDGQFELAYNISRDISLRIGAQAVYSWNGIARANTLTTNINPNSAFGISTNPTGLFDDNHLSAGFLFGVEWRR